MAAPAISDRIIDSGVNARSDALMNPSVSISHSLIDLAQYDY